MQQLNSTIHTALTETCPLDKSTPKKPFIDDETWALRARKLRLRRRISQANKQARLDLLGMWFKQWTGKTSAQAHNEYVQHQSTVSCILLKLSCNYWSCTRQLKKKLQTLKSRNVQTVIAEAGHNASAGTLLHLMKPFLGPTNPKKQKRACLPIVKQANGRICVDPTEAQNRWIEFFQEMEGGRRMTEAQYRNHWLQGLRHFLQTEVADIPIQDMPTLCELEAAFRRVQIGKAIGMDQVPPDLCRYCPVQLARLCYPILLKAAIHGQEAAEHKGGKLAIARKQRGDVRDCHTHRSLLVSSHIGKTIHRALRQKSHHLYDAYMQRQQLGGKQKMPVSIPLHMTRAFLRWKTRVSASTAVVFLDLTEAFYRTLRPLAVEGDMSDHSINLMCARLGLDSDAMQDLNRLLQEPAALAEAQAPAHVQKMLQAFHRDTWFQIGTQTDPIRTEIGSRPGDSFADVVFGLLWAKLLRKLEADLVRFGILEHIPMLELPDPYAHECTDTHPRIPLLGPTWMDDLSMFITAPSNEELIAKTKLAVSLLLDACYDFQMAPNLKRGKTEIMFTFRGPQSRKFRREYYSAQPGLTVVCERQTVTVPIVTRYVHLGGLIHHRDVNRQEIRRRLAIATQAFQQHKRLLYRNRQLDWSIRCDMFNTLIMSKFLYGLESWTFNTNQSRMQIHNGITRLYRKLLGVPHDTHITDAEVLVKTNMPDPTELLRRARLRYFGTLHNCRHHSQWGLLQEDTVWIDMLRDDLQWLWGQIGESTGLGDPVHHFPQWQDLIVHHGVYWKKLIRKGIQHACLQRKKEFHAVELHQKIGTLLQQEGWIDCLPTQDIRTGHPADHACYGYMQCGRNFASLAGESVHMCRTRGIIAQERFLFDDTHCPCCPCCLKEYHSFSKVLAHLRFSSRCRDTLRARRMSCTPEPGNGSQADRIQVEANDGALPTMQAQGPKLPMPVPQQWEAYGIPFFEALYLHLAEDSTQGVLAVSLRNFIRT